MFDKRTEELIAVGATIGVNCQPCLDIHAAKAREAGATDAEIRAAVEVAKQVRAGAQAKMDRHAAKALGGAEPAPASVGCGCGD